MQLIALFAIMYKNIKFGAFGLMNKNTKNKNKKS